MSPDGFNITAAAVRLVGMQEVALAPRLPSNREGSLIRYRGALRLWEELTGLEESDALRYAHELAARVTSATVTAHVPPL